MIEDALQWLRERILDSRQIGFHNVSGINDATLMMKPDGETEWLYHDNYRRHDVQDLRSFNIAIEKYSDSDSPGVVFINENYLIFTCDDEERRDTVTLHLKKTPQWRKLEMIARKSVSHDLPMFDQKQLLEFLTFDFNGHIDSPTLLPAVRKIRWSSLHQTDVQPSSDSLGIEVNAAADGVEEFPSQVGLKIPLFENLGCDEQAHIEMHFGVCPEERQFIFTPFPGELDAAVTFVLSNIWTKLTDKAECVLRGTP